MRAPVGIGTHFMRAGMVFLALAVAGAGVAEAKPKKKRVVAKATSSRVVDTRVWQRGYADIVIDANTGKVLHATNPDALRHPASLTKIMTLYMLFEQLESRKLRLDSELTVSAYAASQQPSKLGVKPGSTIDVDDAIKALVTRSANDVAVVIAENIAGDSSTFATLMTRKARALGMSRTTFKNPNGLPNPAQVTTARDLATLGRAIQERFPRYYAYFATRSFYYKGVAIANHNRLLGRIEGVDGIKTGYTAASGFNLVTNVRRDGRHLVAVVLGGTSGGSRDARMAGLIRENFDEAYAGRQIVAPVTEVAVAEQPEAEEVAVAEPAAPPAPAAAPVLPPARLAAPRLATANAAMTPEISAESLTTAAIPAPAPVRPVRTASLAPAAVTAAPLPAPVPGSAAPIVPTPVKTISVPRPAAPVAALANQPGTLGTLTFSSAGMTSSASMTPPTPAKPRPVQVASAGPVELPRPIASAPARSGWAIQIGAFGTEAEAQAHIAKAQAKASKVLTKVDPYTEEAVKGSAKIVRARFAGFDAEAAARNACSALKRNDFACMVFRN